MTSIWIPFVTLYVLGAILMLWEASHLPLLRRPFLMATVWPIVVLVALILMFADGVREVRDVLRARKGKA